MGRLGTTLDDLLEEAKRRTVLFLILVVTISYCMSLTSSSVLRNVPVALLILAVARRISLELVIRWRPSADTASEVFKYCKRLSPRDPLLLPLPPSKKWRSKIDSPPAEAAIDEFTHRIVSEFVTNLWYSAITPDQEVPLEIRGIINGVIGELSVRAKQVNLINLLTRDIVNLVASHLESYREVQASVGTEFGTLSSEERDERIKERLSSLQKLHPAVRSLDMECQVLQKLMGGVLAVVMKPEDANCKLARCLARELLACAVMRPVMNFASPRFINEVIEWSIRRRAEVAVTKPSADDSKAARALDEDLSSLRGTQDSGVELAEVGRFDGDESGYTKEKTVHTSKANVAKADPGQLHTLRSDDWAHAIDVMTERKTQALAPEHLDNLWAKGRNYRKKEAKKLAKGDDFEQRSISPESPDNDVDEGMSELHDIGSSRNVLLERTKAPVSLDDNYYGKGRGQSRVVVVGEDSVSVRNGMGTAVVSRVVHHPLESPELHEEESVPKRHVHRRSHSSGGLDQEKPDKAAKKQSSSISSTYKSKLSCRVIGAHHEKSGSKSFAVYSVSVSDAEGQTWVVLRRYRNFEQLHRRLRDMPHYTLSLPPKRFLASNLDSSLIRERCVLLNKYLKDLLSIPSIAELHEVWDFLSAKSQNYGFGGSVSMLTTIADNVDDAVDDVFRQIKGVTGGALKKNTSEGSSGTMAWSNAAARRETAASDIEDGEDVRGNGIGWHSDSEVHNKYGRSMLEASLSEGHSPSASVMESEVAGDEWTPPSLTVPLLNLVDVVFQLEERGWLRRQVLWMAKQVLQLGMGDAIDDWLLTRVQYLRREDVIVSGIKFIQEALWPDGTFLTRHPKYRPSSASQFSFEEQLEAARRAMVVRELIQEQAPTALVSLIGRKQYRRCAKDIYGFLQSNVCIKQLAYCLLEKLLAAAFPELDNLIAELHIGTQ